MKTFLAAALAISSSVLLAPAANAVCVRSTPDGGIEVSSGSCSARAHHGRDKCSFWSHTDVTREEGWQTGEIYAGPLVTLEAGILVCSVHVNNNTHDGPALVTESVGATAGGVAVMTPRLLNYPATEADDVALCTAWYPASGGALYWTSPNPLVPTDLGHWDTSASSSCGLAVTFKPGA